MRILLLLALLAPLAGCDPGSSSPGPSGPSGPSGAGLTLLATVDTRRSDGQNGLNADVWLHQGIAYVGTWGSSTACPGSSIKVVDVGNPQTASQIATLAEYPLTTSEDVVVRRVDTAAFHGSLLLTGLQRCITSTGRSGLDLWDVTDPRRPLHLGSLDLGNFVRGVSELDLEVRGGSAYAYLAVPGGESTIYTAGVLVVDVSVPQVPRVIAGFGLPKDLGEALGPDDFVHSVRADPARQRLLVSYWDKGVVVLDVADPGHPRYLGRTVFPAGAEGNAGSAALAKDGAVLVECDQDTRPDARSGIEAGSGYLRFHDIGDLSAPRRIGEFRTPHSQLALPPAGAFTAHNAEVVDNTAFVTWYSDGLRILDLTQPQAARELASFVPPAVTDPFHVFPTTPLVWGVAVAGDLVLASDINAGLYVLRYR